MLIVSQNVFHWVIVKIGSSWSVGWRARSIFMPLPSVVGRLCRLRPPSMMMRVDDDDDDDSLLFECL